MDLDTDQIARHVASCLQLGILLEVSASKPGNVNRARGFRSTSYEHFLASAVAVSPSFELAAKRGCLVTEGKLDPAGIGIGEIAKEAVEDTSRWQHGGNTLLGTILLLTPISIAAGMTLALSDELSVIGLRKRIRVVVESTTPADAVAVYEAIQLARPSGLANKAPTLDVYDPESKRRILEEGTTLCDVFTISAPYDSIARECVENYPATFELGFPFFSQQIEEKKSLNTAIVHTFLHVLAAIPDTLIARKAGLGQAKEVSNEAKTVLELGGLATQAGRRALKDFDRRLRDSTNQLNPGTTADILAAILAAHILLGYRP